MAESPRVRTLAAVAIALAILVGFSLIAAVAIYGWDLRPPSAQGPAARTGDPVPFERLDVPGGFVPPTGIYVFRDEGNWSSFWSLYIPDEPPPFVNFTQQMVVVLSQGMRLSSGYSLTVTGVYKNGDGLLLEAQEADPGDGCGVSSILTWLSDIVKLPTTTGPVSVLLHWETVPCPEP